MIMKLILPSWLTLDKDTYTLTGKPDNEDVANYNLDINFLGLVILKNKMVRIVIT